MVARASAFQLISILPFVTSDGVDMKRPFVYPVHLRPMDEVGPLDRAVWRTAKIACADDICLEASNMSHKIEIRAAGLDITTRNAMMEAEACRYIFLEHPLHKFKKGGLNSVVLENTAAPADSKKAMVVTMYS